MESKTNRSVSLEQVWPVFYEDFKTRKISWETHNIEEVAKLAKMPTGGMDEYRLKDLYNQLRQCIYRIQKKEWHENGRLLCRIKLVKGEPVQYGFTRKSGELLNSFMREKLTLEDRIDFYQERAAFAANKLPEDKARDIQLTLVNGPMIKLLKKQDEKAS